MDILTHTLSGVAVATCAVAFVPGIKTKVSMLLVGAVGGALPDLDAISLWSRFDGTMGKLFALPTKGSVIYGSKFWYSHHAFFHSALASLLFGCLLMLVLLLLKKKEVSFITYLKSRYIYFVTFVLAYWSHLAGDLPTPSSVWGGIGFFWPSLEYVGGYGQIWWWNNYDIFLLIVASIVVNLVILLLSRWLKEKMRRVAPLLIFVFFLSLSIYQINTRQFNYAYQKDNSKYAQMEQNSKKEQQRILGPKLYAIMKAFDSKIAFLF